MNCPRLVVDDGHLGVWGALRNVYPDAAEQRCGNHKVLNVLHTLPHAQHVAARPLLSAIAHAQTRIEAERHRAWFEEWCRPDAPHQDTLRLYPPRSHRTASQDRPAAQRMV